MRGGAVVGEIIVDPDPGPIALNEAQSRAGDGAVQGEAGDGFPSGGDDGFGDAEVVFDGAGTRALGKPREYQSGVAAGTEDAKE